MEENNYKGTKCLEQSQHHDFDPNCKNSAHTRCHQHDCCCYRHSHCRKKLCDNEFSIRLGGLQYGLNARLRELLWCKAEFELDDGKTINGTIVSVGSNFVEVLVKSENQVEETIVEATEEDLNKELVQKKPVKKGKKRKHKKGRS